MDVVTVKIRGLDGVADLLASLPAEVVSKRGGPVKLALAKGARLIRDQAKLNLGRSIAYGGADTTGTTAGAVVATRGKEPIGGNGERYLVRVKKKDFINAKGYRTNTLLTANLLEWGSVHQPPTPWLRRAVNERGVQAITVITNELLKQLDDTVRRLAQKNAGR